MAFIQFPTMVLPEGLYVNYVTIGVVNLVRARGISVGGGEATRHFDNL